MTTLGDVLVVAWDRVDVAVEQALLKPAGRTRRVVQSMIDLSLQGVTGGTGTGLTAADRAVLVASRRRAPADEAAPTSTNWPPRPRGFDVVVSVGAAPKPADMLDGDVHFLPTGNPSATVTTSFALADGSAWPTPWVLERPGGGAVVQGGMGRLSSGSVGNYASADTAAERYGVPIVDSDVLLSFRMLTDDAWPRLVLRSDAANLDPRTGVSVGWSASTMNVTEISSGTYNVVKTVSRAFSKGVDYQLRVSLQGTKLNVRAWPAAQVEPQTWDITTTTAATNGYLGLCVGSGSAAGSQTVAFDDIAVTTGGGAGWGSAYGVAYGA